jgi:hypothetical protein
MGPIRSCLSFVLPQITRAEWRDVLYRDKALLSMPLG